MRPSSRVSKVLVTGPLAPFADGYCEKPEERGYPRLSAVNLQRQVAQINEVATLDGRHFNVVRPIIGAFRLVP